MSVKLFAAIDVGSFDLELGIYELSPRIGIREVDYLRHVLALGRDTYNDGKISYSLVEEMCDVLLKFSGVMKSYRVEEYRAYASSALREAKNSQIVLDQIHVRTGLRVRTINNSELRFMSYKAVAARTEEFQKTVLTGTAIVDVGFGSSQISLFDKDTLVSTQNLMLGALRINEMAAHWPLSDKERPSVLEELVDNELHTFRKLYLKEREVKNLIATGESIIFIARRGLKATGTERFTAQQFDSFCGKLLSMSMTEIEETFELDQEFAQILIPSAVIYQRVLEMVGAQSVWVPGIRLCDGIAAEYAQEKKLVHFQHDFNGDILSASRNMAKRYRCHMPHIQEVERAAVAIFDATKKYHGLGARERLLLQIAALLHPCGKFVSITRSTESSYQIIMATEIIGLSHLEREIVANVVRYNIQEFAYNEVELDSDLSQYAGARMYKRDMTILIAKLTAILRLANSLDRSHKQKLKDCRVSVKNGRLLVTTGYTEGIVLEQYSFEQKADFFEEQFGIRPVLKQRRGIGL